MFYFVLLFCSKKELYGRFFFPSIYLHTERPVEKSIEMLYVLDLVHNVMPINVLAAEGNS